MTGEPGNRPITETNPDKAVVYMHDTSDDFFSCYLGNCSDVGVLRAYVNYEVDHDCRQERVAKANTRIQELKNDKRGTAGNQTAV